MDSLQNIHERGYMSYKKENLCERSSDLQEMEDYSITEYPQILSA